MTEALEIVLHDGLKALFLISVPLVAGVALAGTLTAAVQGATSLHDSATAYAVRLLALVVVLYLYLPAFLTQIAALAQYAFR